MFKPNSKSYKILAVICSIAVAAGVGYFFTWAGNLDPPGAPTSGTMFSLEEMAEKTSGAFDRDTDSLEAISEAIDSMSTSGLPDTNQVTCYNDTVSCTCGATGCTDATDWPNQTAQNAEDGNRDNDFTVDAAVCGTAGSVYDSLTGLCWEKDAGTATLNWKAALQECNDLSLSGHTDWRLPKAIELVSIVDYGYEDSSYWHAAKFLNEAAGYYWSSTTQPNGTSYAYILNFTYGDLNYNSKTNTYYVVCVRDK